jgi:CubicO group peptidase (beta-lactamase class C family)
MLHIENEYVGGEAAPRSVDIDPAGAAGAIDLVRQRRGKSQSFVVRDGVTIVDRASGCAPDELFWTFSAGKPYVAVLVHLLAERGFLALDEAVAFYWPEFGQKNKSAVTVGQVLQLLGADAEDASDEHNQLVLNAGVDCVAAHPKNPWFEKNADAPARSHQYHHRR